MEKLYMESDNKTCMPKTAHASREMRPARLRLRLLLAFHARGESFIQRERCLNQNIKTILKWNSYEFPCGTASSWRPRSYRLDAEGRFSGVMMYYPYRFLNDSEKLGSPWPVRPTPYLAARGYAVVQYEVRGTGNSGGWTEDIYSADERRDGYEMVEWLAAQPWCNGNVGMMRGSPTEERCSGRSRCRRLPV